MYDIVHRHVSLFQPQPHLHQLALDLSCYPFPKLPTKRAVQQRVEEMLCLAQRLARWARSRSYHTPTAARHICPARRALATKLTHPANAPPVERRYRSVQCHSRREVRSRWRFHAIPVVRVVLFLVGVDVGRGMKAVAGCADVFLHDKHGQRRQPARGRTGRCFLAMDYLLTPHGRSRRGLIWPASRPLAPQTAPAWLGRTRSTRSPFCSRRSRAASADSGASRRRSG